jgi:hypothetical protein
MSIPVNAIANNDAMADNIGLMFNVNHDAIVEPNAKPVCSPRVIVYSVFSFNVLLYA